jgi:tetratricopeptide (TPR) repeat protein
MVAPPQRAGRRWLRLPLRILLVVVGTLALLELSLLALGQGYELSRPGSVVDQGEHVVTVLSLGESSTALGGESSYPRQLERVLAELDPGPRFRVINGARPGIDSYTIVRLLPGLIEEHDPAVVTVMMGINDGEKEFIELGPGPEGGDGPSWLGRLRSYRLLRFAQRAWAHQRRMAEAEAGLRQHEQGLIDAIAQQPTEMDIILLSQLYRRQARFDEALAVLERAAVQAPSADLICRLGRIHRDMGHADLEEDYFRRAVREYPDVHLGYRWLTRTLRDRGHLDEAMAVHMAEVEHVPDALSWINLANFYWGSGQPSQALAAFDAANALLPSDYGLARQGALLSELGRSVEAELSIRASIALHETGQAWVELARLQRGLGDGVEAEASYRRALALGEDGWDYDQYAEHTRPTQFSTVHLELSRSLREGGDEEGARGVMAGLPRNEISAANYQALLDMTLPRGIQLVVVQYPMRPLRPLELLVGQREGVVFVDNQASFEAAVAREGYNALFVDSYGGDFGHCSARGNRVVAENIASAMVAAWYPGAPTEEAP